MQDYPDGVNTLLNYNMEIIMNALTEEKVRLLFDNLEGGNSYSLSRYTSHKISKHFTTGITYMDKRKGVRARLSVPDLRYNPEIWRKTHPIKAQINRKERG
jgi:hypothetical protein